MASVLHDSPVLISMQQCNTNPFMEIMHETELKMYSRPSLSAALSRESNVKIRKNLISRQDL